MNDTVQSNSEYLNSELSHIMSYLYTIGNPLLDMAFPIIRVDNNLTSNKEKDLVNELDNALNAITKKMNKQIRQFKNAGDKFRNLDILLDKKEYALGLGEIIISDEITKIYSEYKNTKEERKESSKDTFDNLVEKSDYNVYDVSAYIDFSAPIYVSFDEKNNQYVVYIKPEDMDNAEDVIDELKEYVVSMIESAVENEGAIIQGAASIATNSIKNISDYTIGDDYVEISLPRMVTSAINTAKKAYPELDPSNFLTEENMVCKGES